ncbi:MAG: signal peptide peptidase SppA [Gammaproteobacteria bacterium]|nr:MAG: signal peptide peptidase SppA [Gammaproteobacteria bacterium]
MSENQNNDSNPSKPEWQLIEKLLQSAQSEKKSTRRWGIFFKLLTFSYLFFILAIFVSKQMPSAPGAGVNEGHTALVDVHGVISEAEDASADNITSGLRAAFEAENSKSIIMRINSPGGSPVQSDYVFNEIQRLKEKHPEKKLYAVITDVGASGAYYIAAAADEIYANPSSIVGSIGVIMGGGFGFEGLMGKLGVERRTVKAGAHKDLLDPFSPVKGFQQKHMQSMLDGVHEEFINSVKSGRGDRLKDDPLLFTGLFWNGRDALELGLVDAFGSAGYVAREIIEVEKIVDYTVRPSPVDAIFDRLGVSIGGTIAQQLGLSSGFKME